MRGRRPSGPECVEHLTGSTQAQQRLRVLLETLAGQCRVTQACQQLGISEQRFRQLRTAVLQAALESLEPQPRGRPPAAATPPTGADVAVLHERIAALEAELEAAQLREEIALILPQVGHTPAPKKAPRRRRRTPRRQPSHQAT